MVGNFDSNQKEHMQALMSNVLIMKPRVTLLAVVVSMLASILLASNSFAASANNSKTASSTVAVAPVEKSNKIFSIDASLAYESNMYADGEYDKSENTSLSLVPAVKLTDRTTLSLSTNFVKNYTADESLSMSNTSLRLSHKTAEITDELTWKNRLDGIAPTNRDSQLTDRLQGAVALRTSLTYANKNPVLPFTIVGLLAGQRNFHEYDMNADGAKNNQYGITQGLSLDLSFTDNLSLSFAGNYRTAINYEGTQKYAFDTSIDLSYSITDNFGLSTGISNGGSALRANGIDSNISFLDKKSSAVNIAMNFNY